jgi:hypothetical protein
VFDDVDARRYPRTAVRLETERADEAKEALAAANTLVTLSLIDHS